MTTEKTKTALPGTAAESDAATPAQKPATEPATITTAQRRTESDAAETRESAETYTIAQESGKTANTSGTTSGPTTTAEAGTSTATVPTTDRRQKVFDWLDSHGIAYTWYEHPEAPTIEIARRYWRDDGSKHCKNLFFRNHKGNRHYLVAFDCMERWLGLRPGSVSPFGLINDPERHVHLFLDRNLKRFPAYSFHPNDNRATVVVSRSEFLRYLTAVGNTYEFIELY